jgi:NADPH:quinone reductase-like Zn-dependent oxidoreductase
MKAIVIDEFGAAEQLHVSEVEKPFISDEEVLIRVIAAGLNPVDTKIRSGIHVSSKTLQLPAILGKDMSGIVEEAGKNVQAFKAGDAVFGCIARTYAEYVIASPELIVKKPENVSFEAAAAVSLAGLTAYQAINDQLKVKDGDRVLIQSAAGGVGHLAVQFAKLNGAFVYGTASEKNLGFIRSLGVDQPINYKEVRFEDVAADLDAVMDTMGGEVLYQSINAVKPGGRVVCLPSSTKDDPKALALAAEKGVTLSWFMMTPKQEQLQLFAELLGRGALQVEIGRTFPMEEMVEAHKEIESHGVRGKLIALIGQG